MKQPLSIKIHKKLGAFELDVKCKTKSGITAIIGPSGAGKTSLLNLISGIIKPDAGEIKLSGKELNDLAPHKRKIGYVFQEGLLFPHMNVESNIKYGATGEAINFDELVELFDLSALLSRMPATLSGGETRRVAIARALCSQPEILLLDEPLSGIDPSRRNEFFPYLERLKQSAKMPIFYVTHQMDEVMRLADNVMVMDKGRVAIMGKLEDIAAKPAFTNLAGNHERSVVLSGIVAEKNGLCELTVDGGKLILPHNPQNGDGATRVRILARDVAIATKKPEDISVLNILKVSIEKIEVPTDFEVDLTLRLGTGKATSTLTSRITKASAERLGIKQGMKVWALIKAVAILN